MVDVDVRPFARQVAGHGLDGRRSFLKLGDDGLILKPLQDGEKGERERSFFELTLNTTAHLTHSQNHSFPLTKWVPKYHGLAPIITSESDSCRQCRTDIYLILDDVTAHLQRPNIIDLKIGRQTWIPGAPIEKQEKEARAYPGTRPQLGFSLSGMILHDVQSKDVSKFTSVSASTTATAASYHHVDKTFGKQLTSDTVDLIPQLFFGRTAISASMGKSRLRHIVDTFVAKLERLKSDYAAQKDYLLYASSILLAFDTAVDYGGSDGDDEGYDSDRVVVKVIDFAHAYRLPTPNPRSNSNSESSESDYRLRSELSNFTDGLDSVIRIFCNFRNGQQFGQLTD